MATDIEAVAEQVFVALADPTRRQILLLLTTGVMSINMLADNFAISRPAVSKHIKLLEQAGLVAINDTGRERYCSLDATGFNEVRDWLAFYDQFWTKNLGRLGEVLDKHVNSKNKKV